MAGGGYDHGTAIERLGRPDAPRARFKVPQEARSSAASVDFDCHLQCVECGFQRLTTERMPACPACGDDVWADLREGGVVEALIEQNDTRWDTRDASRRGLWKLIGVVVGTVLMTLSMRGDGSFVFYPLVLMAVFVVSRTAFNEYRSGKRAPFATSWRYVRAPQARPTHSRSGLLTGSTPLVAPLSGRSCIAYELGVRRNDDVADEAWSWALLEQRAPALELDGAPLERQPHLALRRQHYTCDLTVAAARELRKRGIDPTRPGYLIYETILEQGSPATLEQSLDGNTLRLG